MTSRGFILASLRHYRRIHVAVALGVAVATAVLTGALLVGDSVRGSLRDLTLERLGFIDSALVSQTMFRDALADEIAANPGFRQHFAEAEPVILMTGTLQSGSGANTRRATSISVVGCRPSFMSLRLPRKYPLWHDLAAVPWSVEVDGNEIVVTNPIAGELGIETGDRILLRIPTTGAIPADSPLGEKSETSLARSFTVKAVAPDRSIGRFGLSPSQHQPRNVFVPLDTLQDLINQPGKVNAVLVATDDPYSSSNNAAREALQQALKPHLDDYGLRVERIESLIDCFQISANQLVLPDAIVAAAEKAFADHARQPVVTYLANTISAGSGESQRKIPYSTITGVDSTAELGPLLNEAGQPIVLADDEIALNRWTADDLNVTVGDTITVSFYEPESTHGRLREREPLPQFKLAAIVELKNAEGRPTAAADPKLTPELPGVTDQESINDWELPFELVEKIRPQDEEYWDEYRTTPKAFVSLATAKRLWPSRWGTISLLRLPINGVDGDAASAAGKVSDQLLKVLDPESLGLSFLPVKEQGLAASAGTTPFDWLFLGFSFFLMASAVMLIAILFQLGVEQRARELGTLAAVGVGKRRIMRLFGREGLIVAAIGAGFGVAIGIFYAWLMIRLLRTWWVAAIATPFLELHVTPRSLVVGWVIGVAISWLTILWSTRRLVRQPASRLLAGATGAEAQGAIVAGRTASDRRTSVLGWAIARAALLLLTIALLVLSTRLEGEAQAGVFFATGAMVLVLMLGEVRHRLRLSNKRATRRRTFTLPALSSLNTARNPGRSTLTVGLVAAASFLIVAISAFRLETGEAGTGGFDFLAASDLPVHYDLNTPQGRLELGFSDAASESLNKCRVYSLRVADGEDASCLNLYQPTQPRVLGVPDELIQRGGFAWTKTRDDRPFESGVIKGASQNPWTLLNTNQEAVGQDIYPVVLDASTAIYSLHLGGIGDRLTIRDAAGNRATLEVVGLLKNSVLQGNLLMSEKNFLRLFPDTRGYRFFLIDLGSRLTSNDSASDDVERTSATAGGGERSMPDTLESALAEEGFDVVDAREQLGQFLAVQNTYLSTFQSLGALGLLLGTIGLAVVQLRSVLERRAELALMRATGFRSGRLTGMIVWENGVLLLGGLLAGSISAAITLLPQSMLQEAGVPWRTLAALLGVIVLVGILAAWIATRSALRAPILPALRGD